MPKAKQPKPSPIYAAIEALEQRAAIQNSFRLFVTHAWPQVDSATLTWSWFLELLCDSLDKWGRGEYRNLILAVPPGFAKSLTASVMLPAWIWLRDPSVQFLCASHSQKLANRDNQRTRELIQSEWYQQLVGGAWTMKPDQNQQSWFANTRQGSRLSIGGGTRPTGLRGNHIIIDDPVDANPRKPPRPEDYEAAYDWAQYLRRTRVNDPKTAQTLAIAQRLDPLDPIGRWLDEEPEEWNTVCFDMEYDSTMPNRHEDDPRTMERELLFPERTGTVEVEKLKRGLGPEAYSAQCQQQPVIPGGMIVRKKEIPIIAEPLDKYQYTIVSWDLAFKGDATSSWVVGTVWGVNGPQDIEQRQFDLLDIWRDHVDYGGSKAAVEMMSRRWPSTNWTVVEDKANGPALISELKHLVPTILPFNPNRYGDKVQRLRAITPVIAQGRMRLVEGDWNADFLAEITSAPKCKDWDQIDSTTQCLLGAMHELPAWSAASATRTVRLVGGW